VLSVLAFADHLEQQLETAVKTFINKPKHNKFFTLQLEFKEMAFH
jgi:hypothetical protein